MADQRNADPASNDCPQVDASTHQRPIEQAEMTNPASTERSEQEYFERNTRLGCILFVGNLPFQTPWQHVKDRFQEAGKVRYTDLIADGEGRPKGSALVTMESPDGAQKAIELFNEQLFDGRRLIVRLLEAGRRPALVQKERMPVYGRGRGDSSVQHQSSTYGSRNYAGQHNGLASADRIPAPRPHEEVVPPKPRSHQVAHASDEESGRRLFVGNLPYDCTSAALYDTFMQVGSVLRAEVRVGRNGRPTGIGIVVMETVEEARTAINEFDGIEMAGRAMRVNLDCSSRA